MQTDEEFIRELDLYSVPFGLKISDRFVPTPPVQWARVFAGAPLADGKPPRRGGLDADVVASMRQSGRERTSLPAAAPLMSGRVFPVGGCSAGPRDGFAGPGPTLNADTPAPQAPMTKAHG